MNENAFSKNPQLRHLDWLARLMDSQFKIPGTNVRFGLDPIIGLIPGAGDVSTFAISAFMLFIMVKNGASGFVLARMILNVLIDTILGSIPFLGDVFDFGFKSNTRNMRLMREHYIEGRHQGGAWKVVLPVLILFFALFAGVIWLIYASIAAVYHHFS
jgi:NAD/NADP transhydrogenase beta subunit